MPLNTACVAASVTPTVLSTWTSHYLDRKSRHLKPTAHISYHEGLRVVRAFLDHAAHHTVEELQAFTAQKIPSPRWVKIQEQTVPTQYLTDAAGHINAQLGERGVKRVGGRTWWQWRGQQGDLKCEWIEMKKDYKARKLANARCNRVMFYVHGGAYFFGSLETHRYQMQRHARKLKARVFAPSYRLAPQFPFPCGLHDCLAAYLYLLTVQDPTEIILAGDSAGGGMVLSMLVILRDQGIPLPAGAILISPWADLTHSFPSVAQASKFDYIPDHGFLHRPSRSWPPPNSDDLAFISRNSNHKDTPGGNSGRNPSAPEADRTEDDQQVAIQGFSLREANAQDATHTYPGLQSGTDGTDGLPVIDIGSNLAGNLVVPMQDNTVIEIKDQIQMYAPNQMLSHPLVSPVLQPTLGGLPPLLILTGGGELLRDEQVYLAHKAADPMAYLPPEILLDEHDPDRSKIRKYEPTNVQLQVWDDLCHVAPTLSWTRPAKFMYRSIAQFGAWALAHAQQEEIEIPENDASSTSSKSSSNPDSQEPAASIGKAGDPLPPFRKHMIRQRVDRHGVIYPLGGPESLPGLQHPREKVGALNPAIVKKWSIAKKAWDAKFAKQKLAVQRRRVKDFQKGYFGFDHEFPPACSAASRRMEEDLVTVTKIRKSYGMMLWSRFASKHDQDIIEKENKQDVPAQVSIKPTKDRNEQAVSGPRESINQPDLERLSPFATEKRSHSRSRSRSRVVSDDGQAEELDHNPQDALSETPNGDKSYLLIPGLDTNNGEQLNKYRAADTASTAAVLNADGVLPSNADMSSTLLPSTRNSFLSDQNGSVVATLSESGPPTPSIIATDTTIEPVEGSNASTKALRHVPYILRQQQSGLQNELDKVTADNDAETPKGSTYEKTEGILEMGKNRPEMPDREEFVTAEEIPT